MRKKITCFFLLFSIFFYGQDTIPYQYYDANFNTTIEPQKVAYFSFLEFEKNIEKNNLITYYLNGKIRKYEKYSVFSKRVLDGISEELDENGNVISQKNYLAGKANGKHLYFWPNQMLKRDENYLNGEFIDGKCFDENGNEIEYFPLSVRAAYPNGINKFYEYFSKNVFKSLIKKSGRMLVSFTVDTTGNLTDIKIIRDLNDKDLNSNVIGVLKRSPKWIPASYDGKLVSMIYTLPINFEVGKVVFENENYSNQSPGFQSQIIKF